MKQVLFIDVDKTFINGHATFGFIKYMILHKGFSIFGLKRILKILGYLVLDNLLIYDRNMFAYHFGTVAKGMSRTGIDQIARSYFDLVLKNDVREYFRDLLRTREKATPIVLLSGSLDFILEYFKEKMVDEVICSRLEIIDDRATGRFIGEPVVGTGKFHAFLCYCKEHGIEPQKSTFYTDHYSDSPILEAVGTPIAYRPDRKLRAMAKKTGWSIIE